MPLTSQSEKPSVGVADLGQSMGRYGDCCYTTRHLVMGPCCSFSAGLAVHSQRCTQSRGSEDQLERGEKRCGCLSCRVMNLTMITFRQSWHLPSLHLQNTVPFTFVSYEKYSSLLTNLPLCKAPH